MPLIFQIIITLVLFGMSLMALIKVYKKSPSNENDSKSENLNQESNDTPNQKYDGYISKICVHGKTYGIKAVVTEVYPISCPKCGASFELHHGEGECPYCHTKYSTTYHLVEK